MIITTERLTVRRVRIEDRESIKRIWDDQKRSVYARFDRPNDTAPEAVRKRIEKWGSFSGSMEHMFFSVCLEEAVIGYVAFNRREDGYEIGYCFHSGYHGKGYARESISALISYIRDIQPGTVITAGTASENLPSVSLLKALGFIRIGSERLSFYKDANGQSICFEGGIFQKTLSKSSSQSAGQTDLIPQSHS